MGEASTSAITRGLSFAGTVTAVISATEFLSSLGGYGNGFFENWDVYVVRKNDGSGDEPQGEFVRCQQYISNNGRMLLAEAFGVTQLAAGDQIYLIHPFLSGSTYILDQPSNNLKQSDLTEASTAALLFTLVKQITYAGKVGNARVSFDLRVDLAGGIATAAIYKNGFPVITDDTAVPPYTQYVDNTGAYQTFTQDISGLVAGDLIGIYAFVNAAPRSALVRNFQISYDVVALPSVQSTVDGVYVNTKYGVSGTDWPIGTPGVPVVNIVNGLLPIMPYATLLNAIGIAKDRGLSKLYLSNPDGVAFRLTADLPEGYEIIGPGPTTPITFYPDGFNSHFSIFRNLVTWGGFDANDAPYLDNCEIYDFANMGLISNSRCSISLDAPAGFIFVRKSHVGNIDFVGQAGSRIQCVGCDFEDDTALQPSQVLRMTDVGSALYIIGGSGRVHIDATCTAGTITVQGNIVLTIDPAATVTVIDLTTGTSSPGQLQNAAATIDLNQAAATYTLLTGTGQVVFMEALIITMPNAAAGGALTSISIQTDDATPQIIIDDIAGAVANLTAEAQLSWTGRVRIGVGKRIRLTINGGATGAGYVCDVDAQYRAAVSGGSLV